MTRKKPRPLDQAAFARDIIDIHSVAVHTQQTVGALMLTTRYPILTTPTISLPDPTSMVSSLWLANCHANKLSLQLTAITEQLYTLADELCQARTPKSTPPKEVK